MALKLLQTTFVASTLCGMLPHAAADMETRADIRWGLSMFSGAPHSAVCDIRQLTGATGGTSGSGCRQFPPATNTLQFDGYGKFNIRICPGGLSGNPCQARCGEPQNTNGPTGCVAVNGYNYYEVFQI